MLHRFRLDEKTLLNDHNVRASSQEQPYMKFLSKFSAEVFWVTFVIHEHSTRQLKSWDLTKVVRRQRSSPVTTKFEWQLPISVCEK